MRVIDLEQFNDEEIAAMVFAMEREVDWARHGEDYNIREEYLDACYRLLDSFNGEFIKRDLNLNILGDER